MKRFIHVVGARPNFMKMAPIIREMERYPEEVEQRLVHTGQHYDEKMSQIFFEELGMPRPDINLEVGSGSHAWQTAEIMKRSEEVLLDYQPDCVVVPGDVNSTLAVALVASKLQIPIAHLEAGLRSFDRTMPEEINRVLTDQISDILLTPSTDGDENLRNEGIAEEKIHFVGNAMIDTLVRLLPAAEDRWPILQERFEVERYVLCTLHRPANVDDSDVFSEIVAALLEIAGDLPLIFPVHPRTRNQVQQAISDAQASGFILSEPLGYLDFLALQAHAALVLTDSGGVQEETTYLGVPCLTVRPNTERPVTITHGTNQLVVGERQAIVRAAKTRLAEPKREMMSPPTFWDGRAAGRVVDVLHHVL